MTGWNVDPHAPAPRTPKVQRLASHRGHQAPRRGNFLSGERPSRVPGDQHERALLRQPVQLVGTAAAAENRLGRTDHQPAAGQYLNEITDLIRAGAQVIDGDNGAELAEQLGALPRSQLDRLIADIQLGYQILQQIPDTIPARPHVDTAGGETALCCGSRDVPQERRLAVSAGRIEPGRSPSPDGGERVGRLPVAVEHHGFPQCLSLARGEQIIRGLPEANAVDAGTCVAADLGKQIAMENGAHLGLLPISG